LALKIFSEESHSERGSVTLFFLAFVLVIFSAISLSVFIGGRVHHQIRTDQAADASAQASAAQTSQGLNMIAVNNLGIASAIQIQNSFLLMAYYVGILRALAYSYIDLGEDLVGLSMGKKIQTDVFDLFNNFARVFTQAAQGLTTYNQKIRSYWMYLAPLKALEFGKLNDPGAIVLPFRGEGGQSQLIPFAGFSFEGSEQKDNQALYTSRADDAICVVTSTNPGGDVDPDSMIDWLMGPFSTLEKSAGASGLATNLVDTMMSFMSKIQKFVPVKMGFIECGLALKSPLWDLMTDMQPGGLGLDTLYNKHSFKSRLISVHNDHYDTYGNLLCGSKKAIDVPLFATKVGLGPLFASYGKEAIMKAAMFDQMYNNWESLQHGPNPPPKPTLPFSKINWEQCKEDSQGRLPPGCDMKITIDKDTWVCPFESIVLDNITSSCGGFLSTTHHPRADAQQWFNQVCDEYHQWRDSSKNVKDAGMQMVNWGRQAEVFANYNLKKKESNFGFMIIHKDRVKEFRDRISTRVFLMSPIFSQKEFLDLKICKDHKFKGIDDENFQRCHIELYRHYAVSMGLSKSPPPADGDSSTHEQASDREKSMLTLSAGGTEKFDQESNIFMRMQWAMAKYRPGFLLTNTDPSHEIQPHLRTIVVQKSNLEAVAL